jgi:uncharacterized protein (DUF488 family)
VALLADVRTIPRSRHNPQFNRETLPAELKRAGIEYVHVPELGGLRKPDPDSINLGWKSDGFRGFADYMQSPEFDQALARIRARAATATVAIMCAESVPWRCHRSLISDALVARADRVEHILGPDSIRPHALTRFAKVEGARITYPAIDPEIPGLGTPADIGRTAPRPPVRRRR